jgi:hypothetical protein
MIIYQPQIDSTDRVVWHGGESTQLHYEQQCPDGYWWKRNIQTLGSGVPSSMSEMHATLVDYYNHCQCMEYERKQAMAD